MNAVVAERVVGGTAEVVGGKQKSASLLTRVGERFGVDRELVYNTLKATAFRQRADKQTGERREASNEEMVALLTIADQYGLNPFTRELYAFLDPKSGAIVPIVSVDGWLRIINERQELVSIEFRYSEQKGEFKTHPTHEWIECIITRSDRAAPMVIREYFDEVVRDVAYDTPWNSHPKRMHRHKALIQCARYAFGFSDLHDQDEGERIIEGESMRVADIPPAIASINKQVTARGQKAPIEQSAEDKAHVVASGGTGETKPAKGETKAAKGETPGPTYGEVRAKLDTAKTADDVDVAVSLIPSLADQFQGELRDLAKKRREELAG